MNRGSASEYPRTHSVAISQSETTALGRALAEDVKAHPGASGFRFMATGTQSLSMRIALIQAAEKTIDLQYYTIHDDVTANLLLEAVLRAAARGVRVRFLIDNITLREIRKSLSVLDNNKNIEVRVFNPLITRDQPWTSRLVSLVTDLGQATKRMHNKALIADNQMAIIGGRNLGDEYFQAHAEMSFKDTDILAAGPITARISQNFDNYWNSDDSFPITALHPRADSAAAVKLRQALREHWDKEFNTEDGRKMLNMTLAERLKDSAVSLRWARADMAADEPGKITQPSSEVQSIPMLHLDALAEKADKELVIVSPYFVPQDKGVQWLSGLVKRGMRVRVLTNSLSSTDVVAVHTGYARYRKALVENGVDLYEFKPIDGKRPRQRLFGGTAPAHASLHTKLYIVDRKQVVVGSFNFDPRSIALNTELALVIHSPAIASDMLSFFEEAIAPENSYHLVLEHDDLVWKTNEKQHATQYENDPKPGFWRTVQFYFTSLLPVEDQL